MLAARRSRVGVTRLVLFLPGRRRGDRLGDEALALDRRQGLVFGALLPQVLVLLARDFRGVAVVLARLATLLRAQVRPALHAPLHPFLLLGLHLGVAVGDADPLALALGL